jgi:transcriptional regulator of nitric oxide reductase
MVDEMEEGRKRVLGIMASILVSRHLKTTEDLHDSRPSPRTESLVASAVQWAERIMRGSMERLRILKVTDAALSHRVTGLKYSKEEENKEDDEGNLLEDAGDNYQEDDGGYSV